MGKYLDAYFIEIMKSTTKMQQRKSKSDCHKHTQLTSTN